MPRLRLIATSDLHAHAQPYDYIADRARTRAGGLAAAAAGDRAGAGTRRRRRARPAFSLFETNNGDLLQGRAARRPLIRVGGPRRRRDPPDDRGGSDAARLRCGDAGNHDFN